MHYEPVTTVNNIKKKLNTWSSTRTWQDIPIHALRQISKAYTILNKIKKFQESIKYWNRLSPTYKAWIVFKTIFRESYQEFTKTG